MSGKFAGRIGFASTVEKAPGVWVEEFVERPYKGDVRRVTRRLNNVDQVNDNVVVSNTISILSDAYAELNFFAMRYVEWMGAKWTINTVEVQRPRLVLHIGGVYNGQEA